MSSRPTNFMSSVDLTGAAPVVAPLQPVVASAQTGSAGDWIKADLDYDNNGSGHQNNAGAANNAQARNWEETTDIITWTGKSS